MVNDISVQRTVSTCRVKQSNKGKLASIYKSKGRNIEQTL